MDCLSFVAPDRIGRFDEFWPEFRDNAIRELGLSADVSLEDLFQIDIHIAVPDETPFPSQARVLSESDDTVTERNGFGSLVKRKRNGYFYEVLEPAASTTEEWDRLAFEPPGMDSRYEAWKREVAAAKRKGRCVFGKIGGPYLRTGMVRGEAEWLMDIAADPPFAREAASRYGDFLLQIGLEELRRGDLFDTGIWIFDDMGSNMGPVMSPASFEKVFYPAYRALVQGLKRGGASKVGLHSDGNIRPILDMLIDAGIDLINPVEPKAGMSIPALRRQYGEKLAYVGGMCNAFVLPSGDKGAIRRSVVEILECARDGGVVIGAHSIGPDVAIATYQYYLETVLNEGCIVCQE